MSTKSHDFLCQEIFTKSVLEYEPELEIKVYEEPQMCSTGNYYDIGWREMMERKIDIYLDAVGENDEFFIWSDVDIEFYDAFVDECLDQLGDYDIAFQKGTGPDGEGEYCAGFFICRINNSTKIFFHNLKDTYDQYPCDQEAINHSINQVKAKFLSDRFFNVSSQFRQWDGQSFNIPKDIIMFHANYTIGTENKIKMMIKARNFVNFYKKQDIKFLSAEYGVFHDITDIVPNAHSYNDYKNILLNYEDLPILDKYLYLFDEKYELINKPVYIINDT
tara:strand:- start:4320 stop:5147 length:828 start_codon:yes stop_codon:yes gene_type:complete